MIKNYTFSWKRGLLWAGIFVVAGFALFMLVGGPLDVKCKNTDLIGADCQVYLAFDSVVQAYADTWRSFFAPRCVGNLGPDDCLGPDFGIMFWTLAASGMLIGGFSKRKKPLSETESPKL